MHSGLLLVLYHARSDCRSGLVQVCDALNFPLCLNLRRRNKPTRANDINEASLQKSGPYSFEPGLKGYTTGLYKDVVNGYCSLGRGIESIKFIVQFFFNTPLQGLTFMYGILT